MAIGNASLVGSPATFDVSGVKEGRNLRRFGSVTDINFTATSAISVAMQSVYSENRREVVSQWIS